ncbi:hypothetical protein MTP99_003867, partial [Tenebrio molitor]
MVCTAKKCENKAYNCNLAFFTFPKEHNRARSCRPSSPPPSGRRRY